MVIYLNIPYKDRKIAKEYGGIWDKDNKRWFCDDETNELCSLYEIYNSKIEIKGEDRSIGGNELFIDLIPKTSYFKNVRNLFSDGDWNLIRHHIYERANYRCECCGIKRMKYLEAHERWIYDFETKTQKLIRIIALCRLCHQATHYGHSKVSKDITKINNHLKKVRKITDEELKEHINESYEIWKKRNEIEWKIDTSIITNSGFIIKN
jgi:hypothetical protein